MPNGVRARFYPECDSTNRVAASLAQRNPEEQACWIIAGSQSAGRGRRGRVWTSESGNLYCSLLWRPALSLMDLAALPYITALAVRDMLIDLGADAATVACKWPNDVLIANRKAAGILIESSARAQNQLDYVVIGIGVNLMHFPGDAQFEATSLIATTGKKVGNDAAIKTLAKCLYERLDGFNPADMQSVYEEWTEVSWGLGKKREIRTANETFTGTPIGLAADGGLKVQLDGGNTVMIYAGDVFPVRQDKSGVSG